MANTLQIKRSTTAGKVPQLAAGELGANLPDNTLYVGQDDYTKLLIHSDTTDGSTTFTDASPSGHTLGVSGNTPAHDDAQKKFGATSMKFVRSVAEGLSLPDSTDFDFGTGSYTIDCWLRADTLVTWICLFEFGQHNVTSESMRGVGIFINDAGQVRLHVGGPAYDSAQGTIQVDTWHHLAVSKEDATNTTKVFVDGVEVKSTTNNQSIGQGALTAVIGRASHTTSHCFNGWIEEFRISKGVARYTAAFTPPTRRYGVMSPEPTGDHLPLSGGTLSGALTANGLLTGYLAGTGTVAKFQTTGRESNILIQNDAQTWKIVNYDYGNNGTDHLGFHDGTADRLVIGNNGQIGMGTTTFGANSVLEIHKASGNHHLRMKAADNASCSIAFRNATGNEVYCGMFGDQSGGINKFGIYNGGLRMTVDSSGATNFTGALSGTTAAFSGRVTAGDFEMLDLGGTGRTLAVRDGSSNTVKIGDGGTFSTFRFNATQVAPNNNNNCILGASSLRWSTIYGVLGNFSGAVTWSGGGSANANTAYSRTHLPTEGNYQWAHSDTAGSYTPTGVRTSFVRAADGWPSYGAVLHVGARGGTDAGGDFQLYMGHGSNYGGTHLQFRSADENATPSDSWTGWKTIWDTGNDGAGSGLDADLIDGLHLSQLDTRYHLASASFLPLAGGTLTGALTGTTATFSGTTAGQLLGKHNFYYGSIANFDADEFFFAFKVTGDQLNNAIKLSLKGVSSSGHLQSHVIDIQVCHYQDILVKSWSGFYNQLIVKVVSDANDQFDVFLKSTIGGSSYNHNMTLEMNVQTLTPGTTVSFSSAGGYSTTTHEHTTKQGSHHTAKNGTSTGHSDFEVDGTGIFGGAVTWPSGGSANANTAYGWGNHGTQSYATESYCDTYTDQAIALLVDSSPSTLNTLNELAAALGDDANYAATITTALGTKAPLASPALTGTATIGQLHGTSSTSEIGSGHGAASIKRIRMHQGGELHFGDTATSNFLGLTEGTVNQFTDTDRLGLYYRNELKLYSNSNTLRVTWDVNGNQTNVGSLTAAGVTSSSNIRFSSGSVGNSTDPGITSSNTNTGIYFASSGVGLGSGSSSKYLFLDSSGNVSTGGALTVNGAGTSTFASDISTPALWYRPNSYAVHCWQPKGGWFHNQTDVHTGAIKIKLPPMHDAMVSFWVDIYEYRNNETFSAYISGYPYQGTTWSYTSAVIFGGIERNFTVRFGDNNTSGTGAEYYVYIGETDSTWNHPQVVVRDVFCGYHVYANEWDGGDDGWDISFATSFANIAQTQSNTLPYGDWNKLINKSSVWTTANDGAGSGLDADLIDGLHLSQLDSRYHLASASFLPLAGGTLTGALSGTSAYFSGTVNSTATGNGFTATNLAASSWALYGLVTGQGNESGIWFSSSDGELLLRGASSSGIHTRIGKTVTPYINNHTVWTAGTDGAGSGLDADLLDGIDSGSFLRSNADDACTTHIAFNRCSELSHDTMATSTGGHGAFQVYNNAYDAFMCFHVGGVYATYLGLDASTNQISVGGWSGGAAKHKIWNAGNDGSGSGLDADTVDGLDSGDFLRSNDVDISTKRISFQANATQNWDTIATASGGYGSMEVYNDGVGNDAFMSFHANNDFALYFGLDADNNSLSVGGWSMGNVKHKVWHAGNDGSGSGLDADLFTGAPPTYFNRGSNIYATMVGASGWNLNDVFTNGATNRNGFFDAWSGSNYPAGMGHVHGIQVRHNTTTHYGWQLVGQYNISGKLKFRNVSNNSWTSWYDVWTSGSDGTGSGLDADLLDGLHLSQLDSRYHLASVSFLPLAGGTLTGALTVGANTTLSTNGSGHTLFGNNTANKDMNYTVTGTGGHYFAGSLARFLCPVKIVASGLGINLDTPSASQNCWVTWNDNGTAKWEIGKNTANKLYIHNYAASATALEFDSSSHAVFGGNITLNSANSTVASTGNLYLGTDGNDDVLLLTDSSATFSTALAGVNATFTSTLGVGTSNAYAGQMWVQGSRSHFTSSGDGHSAIRKEECAMILGPSTTRQGGAGSYFAGIGFDHLLNYSTTGNVTYHAAGPHCWIGMSLVDTPGYERSALVFGTRTGTGGSDLCTEKMRVQPDGSVGIGTLAPSALLHVAGKTLITRTGNGVGFELQATSSTSSKRILSKHYTTSVDGNYFKLLVPQTYASNTQNGGHIKLTVTWMGGHASHSFTKVAECTYGTSHGRGSEGHLDISPFAVTHESNSHLSHGPYAITPTLTLYRYIVEDAAGYCGLMIKVGGHHSQNKEVYIEAEVTGFLAAEPLLTHFGTSNESGAVALSAVTYIGGDAGGGVGGGTIIGGALTVSGATAHDRTIPNRWFGTADADNGIDTYGHLYAKAHFGGTYKYTTSRPAITTDANYWVGSMGWGTSDFNTMFGWGSGSIDSWGNPGNQPSGTSHWVGSQHLHYHNGSTGYGTQRVSGAGNPSLTYIRGLWGGAWSAWYKDWNAQNDGAGSGLDADLLDGQQGSYYDQSNFSGSAFVSRNSGNAIAIDSVTSNMVGYVNTSTAAGFSDGAGFSAAYSSSWVGQLFVDFRSGKVSSRGKNSGTWQAHRFMWDHLNDGAGSGLDADLIDGLHLSQLDSRYHSSSTSFLGATAKAADSELLDGIDSTKVSFGSSGYAVTHHQFATLTNQKAGFYDYHTTGTPTSTWYSLVNMAHYGGNHGHQIAGCFYSYDLWHRYNNNTSLSSWSKIWSSLSDGSGSGLDADLLDGQQGSYYDQTASANFSGSGFISRTSGNPIAINSVTSNMVGYVNGSTAAGYSDGAGFSASYSADWIGQLFVDFRSGKVSSRGKNSGTWQAHRFMWDHLNDGSGSGLDADLIDGLHLSQLDGRYLSSSTGWQNASNLNSGTVATARLGSGTANSSTYLRGDGTWAAVSGGGGSGDIEGVTAGTGIYGGGTSGTVTINLDTQGSDSMVNVHSAITTPSYDDYMIVSDESASNDPVKKCKIRYLPLAKSSTFYASGCGGTLYMHNPNGTQQDSTSISLTCSGGGGS